ncbi:hypothetical protein M758_5G167200 [Ceratodon purpureus]|nr:hypothetical protein M758_5G167200 [Ceratodon purpureus]
MASAIHAGLSMQLIVVHRSVHDVGRRNPAQFGLAERMGAGTMLSTSPYCIGKSNSAICSSDSMRQCCRGFAWAATSSLRLANQRRIVRGRFFRNITTFQTPRRQVLGFERHSTRAGIKKKVKKAVDGFGVRLQNANTPEFPDRISQLAVSLPLGLASFQALYLVCWVANLRGLLPGSGIFFAAADQIVGFIMLFNSGVGWYAMNHSVGGVSELPLKLTRKLKLGGPGFLDMVFSLALSFVPFANLFLWFRFASKQQHLPAKAKAAIAANAFMYEGPRFFSLLLILSGGLRVFLQVFTMCNTATVFGALHRSFEEARIKNEEVLMEVSRVKQIARKKAQDQKPKEKQTSAEEKERIDRLRELEEFDMLLAQRPSRSDSAFSAKVKDWSVGETMEWLGQQGLARYATTFAENSIDGELLLQLTNDDLRDELKIQSFGDRKKLGLLIQKLKER